MKCTIIQGSEQRTISFDHPQRLSELILKQDIPFSMPCGQNGTCGKCAVIATGSLSEPDTRELKKISGMPQNTRLACQCTATGDCQIVLPQKNNRIVSDGIMPDFVLDAMDGEYGFAVDIGTTTVAVYLYQLTTGKCLKRITFMNPQSSFGADVISRIEKAVAGKKKLLLQLFGMQSKKPLKIL